MHVNVYVCTIDCVGVSCWATSCDMSVVHTPYAYTRTSVRMHTCTRTPEHARTHARTHTHTHTHTVTFPQRRSAVVKRPACACDCVCVCASARVCVCASARVCARVELVCMAACVLACSREPVRAHACPHTCRVSSHVCAHTGPSCSRTLRRPGTPSTTPQTLRPCRSR